MTSSRFWLGSLLLLVACGGQAPTEAPTAAAPQVRSQVVVVDTGVARVEAMPGPVAMPALYGQRAPRRVQHGSGMELLALAFSDESDTDESPPVVKPSEHLHTPDCIHNRLAAAEDAAEVVEVQVEIIEGQHQKADDINVDLAAIIEKLRQEKGLPKKDPYMAPQQVAAENQDRAVEEGEVLGETGPIFEPDGPLDAEGQLREEQLAEEPQEPVEKEDD